MVNLPVFFTSAVVSTEKSSSIFETSPFAMPFFEAKASQMAVFVRAEAAFFFMVFMAFPMAFIAFMAAIGFMAFFFFITFMAFMAAGAAAFMARRIAFAIMLLGSQRSRKIERC